MIRKEKIFMKMQERYSRKICRISTFFAEDSLVRLFQSLENGEDLVTAEEPYFLRLQELIGLSDLHFCVLRMLPDSCRMTKAGHPESQLYKLAGNAVSVPVITALGEKIKRIYEEMESEGAR